MSSNNEAVSSSEVACSASGDTASDPGNRDGSEDQGEVSSSSEIRENVGEDGNNDNEISSSADVTRESSNEAVFAQPALPPPLAPPSKPRTPGEKAHHHHSSPSSSSSHNKEKLSRERQEKYNAILQSLKYNPPEFAAACADPRYNLEVLKNGSIVDSVKFTEEEAKGYYIIGRVPGCDVVAENPTVSRLHAILQFVNAPPKEGSEKSGEHDLDNPQETGLYLYDLKSTHGTFINKNQVFPHKFYRVHVGHVLKFGSSQRMYIVNGPAADEEEESEKSVTELMNEKLQKDLEKKKLEEEEQLKRGLDGGPSSKLPKPNIEEEGIDWGMGEDADEGSDLKVNPFAMDYEANELNLDNPKKTLRSWFEREGYDLEYEMREKGNGQYVCRISLPLDGPTDAPVYAESEVKGKKREAAHDAAMKACQILDSHGILRQSNQESRKRKEKRYDEDYYSSDEDTFLDRTGTVEKKREKRMRLAGKIEEKVETYETLSQKYAELEKEVKELKSKVEKSEKMKSRADDGDIDIDDYMNMLKSGVLDVKKLKSRLKEANEELQRTKKLMDIAKPVELPSYLQNKPSTQTSSNPSKETPEESKTDPSKDDDLPQEVKETRPSSTVTAPTDDTKELGGDSDSSKKDTKPKPKPLVGPMKPPTLASPDKTQSRQKLYGLIKPSSLSSLKPTLRPPDQEKIINLKDDLEEDDDSSPASSNDEEEAEEAKDNSMEATSSQSPKKKKKRQRYRNQQRGKQKGGAESFDYDDPKYSTWVPPKNQTGDGRTSLNEKLGY